MGKIMDELAARTHSYVALCPRCGHVVGAHSDVPSLKIEIAKFVAQCIRAGDRIERWTNEQVRAAPWDCQCDAAQQLEIK